MDRIDVVRPMSMKQMYFDEILLAQWIILKEMQHNLQITVNAISTMQMQINRTHRMMLGVDSIAEFTD